MKKITLKIDGMRCGMCETHVCDFIRKNFNVKKVTASHVKGEATILSEYHIDAEQLKSVIGSTGYRVSDVTEEEYVKKGLFGLFKKD